MIFKFFKYNKINNYIIKLVNNEKLFNKFIYNLKSIKLKILKTYIKINLTNNFFRFYKYFVNNFIFFNKKIK